MKDPRFAATVIYLVKDDNEGAMGLVINRPMTQARVDDLLIGFGVEPKGSDRQITVHYGGPVSTFQGFLLHTDEITVENSITGGDGIAMTSSIKMIEAIADGKGPAEFVFALGYAGWAPGQLHAEITAQAWFVAAADKTLIFGTDAELKWARALEKRQIPL
jgi:putative transcriptional regulator